MRLDNRLDDAESMLNDQPDSALFMLRSISEDDLSSPAQKARYSLLMSMALDKNYIDVASDSIISAAAKFYEKRGAKQDKAKMFFYLGRTQYNAGNYSDALISFDRAASYAEKADDIFVTAMSHQWLAFTHDRTYNNCKALEHIRKASDCFEINSPRAYVLYAKLSMATILLNMLEYEECKSICRSLWHESKEINDTLLMASTAELYALALSGQNKEDIPDEVEEVALFLKDSLGHICSPSLSAAVALSLAEKERYDDCEAIMDSLSENIDCNGDGIDVVLYDYRIKKKRGDLHTALVSLEKAFCFQDSVARYTLKQSIYTAQNDYLKQYSEHTRYVSRIKILILVSVISLLIIAFILIMIKVINYLQEKERKIVTVVAQLEDVVHDNENILNKMTEFSSQIQALYSTQFIFINKICEKYYSYAGDCRNKHILKEVDMMVNQLSEDAEFNTLKDIVNMYYNNVIDSICKEFPKIKPKDIRLLCYWYAGFSASAMSLFLDDKVENIYTRKSRLKSLLLKSMNSDFYLKGLR